MHTFEVTKETQNDIDALIKETEIKLGAILGKPVDLTFLAHASHGENEKCHGTAVMSLMHPANILTSIIYAGMTMERVVAEMMDEGEDEIPPTSH